ncbi:MAG: DUF2029 domain-containing protein [Candidatus Hydrogenedentota bacterium]|nr:MAG: DUF2029 domain-containing protein [Candidatus Hydrogenedentota bacterium]
MKSQISSESALSSFIDKIFSLRNETILLFLVLFLGVILRAIAAMNLGVTADDMHHVTFAVNFLKSGKLVEWGGSDGLWHSFTDLMYNLFGYTQISSRLAALIFGSLTILSLYLLSREFFTEEVSLISAFLLAIAPFHIKNTYAEMDAMAMFFVVTGMFLFIKATKTEKKSFFAMSGIFFGLGIYTKVYPLLFIPSILLYFAYVKKSNFKIILSKKYLKFIFIFLFAAGIFAIPSLTHNYLLYKDKGFMDFIYTNTLGFGKDVAAKYYSWDAGWNSQRPFYLLFYDSNKTYNGKPWLYVSLENIFIATPLLFILGFFGLILSFKKNKNYFWFFVFSIMFALPYLTLKILLRKHFIFMEIFLIPAASFFLLNTDKKVEGKFKKNSLKILLILIFIFSLIWLGTPKSGVTHFYSKSHIAKMIEFKQEKIPKNALIVQDSRIYRGRIHWTSLGWPYLEALDFLQILKRKNELPGEKIPIEVYYFECVYDDCGWGTIKNQPAFNATMESLTGQFSSQGRLIETIRERSAQETHIPFIKEAKLVDAIRIYKTTLVLPTSILEISLQPKKWFLYDIGYEPKEKQFDYYQTHNILDSFLDRIAHLITKLALFLSLFSIVYIFYLVIENG